jgi:hypothetical protein
MAHRHIVIQLKRDCNLCFILPRSRHASTAADVSVPTTMCLAINGRRKRGALPITIPVPLRAATVQPLAVALHVRGAGYEQVGAGYGFQFRMPAPIFVDAPECKPRRFVSLTRFIVDCQESNVRSTHMNDPPSLCKKPPGTEAPKRHAVQRVTDAHRSSQKAR